MTYVGLMTLWLAACLTAMAWRVHVAANLACSCAGVALLPVPWRWFIMAILVLIGRCCYDIGLDFLLFISLLVTQTSHVLWLLERTHSASHFFMLMVHGAVWPARQALRVACRCVLPGFQLKPRQGDMP